MTLFKTRLTNGTARAAAALAVFLAAAGLERPATQGLYRIHTSRLVGGPGYEDARELILLANGSVLVAGQISSTNLPVSSDAYQRRYAGDRPDAPGDGLVGGDCYVLRLSQALDVQKATYLGGSRQERSVYGMAVDPTGDIFITSTTRSRDLKAALSRFGGGNADMLVARLAPGLDRLVWATYLGGSGGDDPRGGLALGPDNGLYIAGSTTSQDFPTPEGSVGARGFGGSDAVVAILDRTSGRLRRVMRFGGKGDEALLGVVVLPSGAVIGSGHTTSTDFAPGRRGAEFDIYAFGLTADLRSFSWLTGLGGPGGDFAEHGLWADEMRVMIPAFSQGADFPGSSPGTGMLLFLDAATGATQTIARLGRNRGTVPLKPTPLGGGRFVVVGQTTERDFPVTGDALQTAYGGGATDGFLAILRPDGSIEYATYLGGQGDDIIRTVAVSPDGRFFLAGRTSSPRFPGAPQSFAGGFDAFVTIVGK